MNKIREIIGKEYANTLGIIAYKNGEKVMEEYFEGAHEILNLDVNNLTPLEALNKLNDIKKIVRGK